MGNDLRHAWTAAALVLASITSCGHAGAPRPTSASPDAAPTLERTLTLAAYTSVREVYGASILPAFRAEWRRRSGEDVRFVESYEASGAQSRAILAGFEADVAALAMEPDVDVLAADGCIHHNWRDGRHRGIVTRSLVVLGVRAGNPKKIREWKDLTQRNLDVLMPNVRTSGGAMWNVLAILGADERGRIDGDEVPSSFLGKVLAHVGALDKGMRDAVDRFETGAGDVILAPECEILTARHNGVACEYVLPSSTILVENPVTVVDRWADKHKNQDLARAFVAFLFTPEAQRMYAHGGWRPVDEQIANETCTGLPRPQDLFTIEDLGGWERVLTKVFGSGGTYDQAQGSRPPNR